MQRFSILPSSSPAGSALPAFLLLSIYRNQHQHQHQLCHNHDINYMLERWSSRTFDLLFYMIIDLQVLDLDLTICQHLGSCLKPNAMLYHLYKVSSSLSKYYSDHDYYWKSLGGWIVGSVRSAAEFHNGVHQPTGNPPYF